MSASTPSKYTFLPWVKMGLGASISNNENKTEILNTVNYIISKLSPLIIEKNRILSKEFLIDLSEDIKKRSHNNTSYLKWIKKQIDTEGINEALFKTLEFLASELSSKQILFHQCMKTGMAY